MSITGGAVCARCERPADPHRVDIGQAGEGPAPRLDLLYKRLQRDAALHGNATGFLVKGKDAIVSATVDERLGSRGNIR